MRDIQRLGIVHHKIHIFRNNNAIIREVEVHDRGLNETEGHNAPELSSEAMVLESRVAEVLHPIEAVRH